MGSDLKSLLLIDVKQFVARPGQFIKQITEVNNSDSNVDSNRTDNHKNDLLPTKILFNFFYRNNFDCCLFFQNL